MDFFLRWYRCCTRRHCLWRILSKCCIVHSGLQPGQAKLNQLCNERLSLPGLSLSKHITHPTRNSWIMQQKFNNLLCIWRHSWKFSRRLGQSHFYLKEIRSNWTNMQTTIDQLPAVLLHPRQSIIFWTKKQTSKLKFIPKISQSDNFSSQFFIILQQK